MDSTPRFAIFAEGKEMPANLQQRFPNLLEPSLRAPFTPKGLWLVRPDGYTALATRSGDWDAVTNYLDHFIKKGSAS